MIKYYLFFVCVFAMYGGLYWFSVRDETKQAKEAFAFATLVVFAFSVVFMYTSLFFCLFGAALMCYVALYIGDNRKIQNRVVIKNGAFGGLWLAMPFYVYLVSNT